MAATLPRLYEWDLKTLGLQIYGFQGPEHGMLNCWRSCLHRKMWQPSYGCCLLEMVEKTRKSGILVTTVRTQSNQRIN
ncbi:hypothetical protein LINPERHAP1_LOCUS39967 [Linum perenne]